MNAVNVVHVELVGAIFKCLDKTSTEETTFGAVENGLDITEVVGRGIARVDVDRGVADLSRAVLTIVVEVRVLDVSVWGVEQLPGVEGSMIFVLNQQQDNDEGRIALPSCGVGSALSTEPRTAQADCPPDSRCPLASVG